jgi:hypothetical protein
MSLGERLRAAMAPPPEPNLTPNEEQRAELNAAIDAIARRRLYHAVREVDAAILAVRQGMGQRALDRLLDARNALTDEVETT